MSCDTQTSSVSNTPYDQNCLENDQIHTIREDNQESDFKPNDNEQSFPIAEWSSTKRKRSKLATPPPIPNKVSNPKIVNRYSIHIKMVDNPSQFQNPLLLARTLRSTFPDIKDGRLLPFGSIRVDFKSEVDRTNALKKSILNLGSKAFIQEISNSSNRIAILNINKMITEQDILEELKFQGLSATSIFSRSRSSSPTYTAIVTFESENEANKIIDSRKIFLGYQRYRVELPHRSPTPQCFRCQKYGHTTYTCTSTIDYCRKCSQQHKTSECESNTRKCRLCNGDHYSSA